VLRAGSRILPERLRASFTLKSILETFSSRKNNVFFIQIGSHDGRTNDPLYEFIMRDAWRGILIEPVPDAFNRLLQTYQDRNDLVFENVAISSNGDPKDFWRLKESDTTPVWYGQLGSFDRQTILKHAYLIPDIEKLLYKEQVRCMTMDELLAAHHVTRVDLLHTDAEGYDYELIKSFDFSRFKPSIVLYEHIHLTDIHRAECLRYLSGLGYHVLEDGPDTIAYL
jgi:FkbM family methyltransferase